MEDAPFGLIELCLVFGLALAAACVELARNRRALAKLRLENPEGSRRPPAS